MELYPGSTGMPMKRVLTDLWMGLKRKTGEKKTTAEEMDLECGLVCDGLDAWCKMAGLYKPQGQRLKEVILASHRRSLDHRVELLCGFPKRYSHCEEYGVQQEVGEGDTFSLLVIFSWGLLFIRFTWKSIGQASRVFWSMENTWLPWVGNWSENGVVEDNKWKASIVHLKSFQE